MSTREWQPGDVAMVTYRLGQCTETNLCAKVTKGWDCLAEGVGFLMHGDVIEARPVIILDPAEGYADREQVWRFLDSLARNWHQAPTDFRLFGGTGILCWLRDRFANPTPPKPDEPTGLGAVVEDVDGNRWVCHEHDAGRLDRRHAWYPSGYVSDGVRVTWAEISAVRVLSEGVTA